MKDFWFILYKIFNMLFIYEILELIFEYMYIDDKILCLFFLILKFSLIISECIEF